MNDLNLHRDPIKFIFICYFLLIMSHFTHAQQKSGKFVDPREAQEHWDHDNFLMAIKVYKQLLVTEPFNPEYNYKLGLCYLNTNINKSLAIQYLEVVTKTEKPDNEAWYDLGRAYHYANRFDDAIKAFSKYKQRAKADGLDRSNRQIEICKNAKELVKFPVNVTFENLGKEINSEFPDYYPFVPLDESFMVFTSRRKENIGGQLEVDGYYPSDIYISTVKNGVWTKPKNIGPVVNTRYDEQAVGLSSDGLRMTIYLDHIDSLGNIYISEYKKTFQKMVKLNGNVNSDFETSGSVSLDGNTIFFASDREGGLGETDIYMSKKLPNGLWAKPQNLGDKINSKYKEDFPHLASDGKTLFFSSQGHSSMGDFDVFKAIWDEETNVWKGPINLGYPVNTTGDNRNISFTANDRVGYISALREGGNGDLDLYRITFNETEQRYTIVNGRILSGDSLNKNIEAIITATDLKSKEEFTYTPSNTGKYVMALSPGKYSVKIESSGYKDLDDELILFDMGSFQPQILKDFQLIKKGK